MLPGSNIDQRKLILKGTHVSTGRSGRQVKRHHEGLKVVNEVQIDMARCVAEDRHALWV